MNVWRTEPALVLGLLQAGIALAVSFGLHLSPAQVGAITAVTAALLSVVTRSQVTPVASTVKG
jgi:hypothetical protein